MSSILDVWTEIELVDKNGLLKRLYREISGLHFYAIFQNPEKYFGIALSFNKNIDINISHFTDLQEINVSLQTDTSFPENNLLIIKLLQAQNRDIFAIICENLLHSISSLESEKLIVQSIINQLKKWETLFDHFKGDGLTISEQQGLFGELHFLEKYIEGNNDIFILDSWVGVNKEVRDFQYSKWALEVKTTSGNNHQRINISSERQLDESLLSDLFLFHISIEISKGNGETINSKIQHIRQLLQNNLIALNTFNNKLLEACYFDKHATLYAERFYKIRNENFYKVEKEFPRIRENEIRQGVGDVKYSIILSQCQEFLISEITVFKVLEDSWMKS